MIAVLHLARQLVPDRVGPVGAFSSNTAPGRGAGEHVVAVEEAELVAADEVRAAGSGTASRIGRGPKRRCEMVTAPDFFES